MVGLGMLLATSPARAEQGTKFTAGVSSAEGVVASISDYASRVGVDVLNRGGNAADAAIAMVFAVGVARPDMGGIGGAGFLLFRGHNGKTAALDFRLTAPALVEAETYKGAGMHRDTYPSGHMVVGVPGVVAGAAEALRSLGSGRFALGELISNGDIPGRPPYAHELARDGVRITYELAAYMFDSYDRLHYYPATREIFQGRVWGDNLKQLDYAKSLSLIAKYGPDAFYKDRRYPEGESIARLITKDMAGAEEASKTNPVIAANSVRWAGTPNDIGLMTLDDLKRYEPVWRTPLVGKYRDSQVIAMPPPTAGGTVTIETLNLIEGFPIGSSVPADPLNCEGPTAATSWEQSSANHLHVLAEAQKIAWADRNQYAADPAFETVPTARLTSKEYAEQRRREIGCEAKFDYKDRTYEGSNTNHLSVIDKQGNAVAVTTSLGAPFGSIVVAPGTGFFLNDELADFNLDGSGANAPAAGKRPRSSQSPTIVVRKGLPILVVGGSGGPTIPMGVIQAIVNVVDFRRDIAQAIDAERIEAAAWGREMAIDVARVDDTVEAVLKARGHTFKNHDRDGEYAFLPILEAVGFNPATECHDAVSDPRNEYDENAGAGAAGQQVKCP